MVGMQVHRKLSPALVTESLVDGLLGRQDCAELTLWVIKVTLDGIMSSLASIKAVVKTHVFTSTGSIG
jgi:hypothetical protein